MDAAAASTITLRHPAFHGLVPPDDVVEAILRLGEVPEPAEQLRPSIALILEVVAEMRGVTVAAMVGERRGKGVWVPRQEAYWLARELTDRSLSVIGKAIGRRDHTTVLHGIQAVAARRAADPMLAQRLDDMGAEAMRRAVARRPG